MPLYFVKKTLNQIYTKSPCRICVTLYTCARDISLWTHESLSSPFRIWSQCYSFKFLYIRGLTIGILLFCRFLGYLYAQRKKRHTVYDDYLLYTILLYWFAAYYSVGRYEVCTAYFPLSEMTLQRYTKIMSETVITSNTHKSEYAQD